MDGTILNVIEKKTEKETDWSERINDNVELISVNKEKDKIIERYEKVLNFLRGVTISKEEDLVHIKKPLDDLECNLKCIPNGPVFNDVFPAEIKKNILSYLCDSEAFIATCVCQEWKTISYDRYKEQGVIIGEECCEDNGCVKVEDMMKAATDHELDVHLVINKPVIQIDKELVTDTLTSLAKFTVANGYSCGDDENPLLSTHQYEHFFESIEKGDKIIDEVKLVELCLRGLNQERLANFLVNKIKRLTLDYVDLDLGTFMTNLQHSTKLKLTHLTLCDLVYCSRFPDNVAEALCKVENVILYGHTFVPFTSQIMGRLLENILQMPITIKTLIISIANIEDLTESDCYDFRPIINPQGLKSVFNKMETLQLEGLFTWSSWRLLNLFLMWKLFLYKLRTQKTSFTLS